MTDKNKPQDKLPDFWLEAQERAHQRRRNPKPPRKPGEVDRHLGGAPPQTAGLRKVS